ncbi:HU family DNA-binding protein [Tenacibaculum sp. IB213877]|uniref:HU family DNA-binding protein n=1 Tax=Tenacibaculum sp. IB213877 TaxID=3097351 RepID=UPI002A5A5773|nr:HU family DNA-binding protein [Tenacibaculum sp. IB213877]MDY0781498.1 HU family DNA-binding protein [Tenacibaculum sp. IB213877]
MSIKFKTMARKNPRDLAAPEKYYASVVANGATNLETMAELISAQCTVTETDCIAVLNILEENIIRELKQGRIVRLGKLGNFQVGISSEGFDTIEEVNANAITKSRILFRPAKRLRKLLSNLTYQKAS